MSGVGKVSVCAFKRVSQIEGASIHFQALLTSASAPPTTLHTSLISPSPISHLSDLQLNIFHAVHRLTLCVLMIGTD